MKRILSLIVLIAALNAGAKDKVVNNPVFAGGEGTFCPRTIVLGKTATNVGITISSGDWSLAKESHLVADGKTYRMTKATVFTRSKGKVIAQEELDYTKNYASKNDSISLEFEPLDPKVRTFDFVEKEESNFNVSGIRLDGKLYPFFLGKQKPFPYNKEEPLKPLEPAYGTAKYTCNMYSYDGTEQEAVIFGLNSAFSGDPIIDGISINGYEMKMSRMYLAPVGAPYPTNQFLALLIPGHEVNINVDETAYLASLAGRKIPEDRIIQFEGSLADIQQVWYQERWMGYGAISKVPAESTWQVTQAKISEIEARKDYSRRQKDFGRILAEWFYIRRHNMDVAAGRTQMQDSHAADLTILKDGRSFYFVNDDLCLDYAHANNIGGVVTQWMEGYRSAINLAKRMRNLELMPETAFDTIPDCLQPELRAMNDSTRVAIEHLRRTASEAKVMETPDCTGEEFVEHVVNENPDVVLFFDFWATWCGPCKRGIKAMEPLKEEWAGRPVRFVYVTDETSPTLEWSKEIKTMPGLHYRLPDNIWNKIPGTGNGIPMYLIYDRQGEQFYQQTGFNAIDPLKQKINEALSK